MVTLGFPSARVEAFEQHKYQMRELMFRKDCNEKLIKEKFKSLKCKRNVFVELCKERLSEEDISENRKTKFRELYLKNSLKMDTYLKKVEEWIQCHSVKDQNSSCVAASQTQEKSRILGTKSTKNSQKSYAKTKLAELKAEYEAENSARKKKLELQKRERQIQAQIEELKFLQKGEEIKTLENKLRQRNKNLKHDQALQSKKLVAVQKNNLLLVQLLNKSNNACAFTKNQVSGLRQHQENITIGNQYFSKELCREENNKEVKEESKVNVHLINNETSIAHGRFGSTAICFVKCIKEKHFTAHKEKLIFLKEKIDCLYDKNLIQCFGEEKKFLFLYYAIHIKLDAFIIRTALFSNTGSEKKIEVSIEAHKSVLEKFNKNALMPLIVHREEEERTLLQKVENTALQKFNHEAVLSIYYILSLVSMLKSRRTIEDILQLTTDGLINLPKQILEIADIKKATFVADRKGHPNLTFITSGNYDLVGNSADIVSTLHYNYDWRNILPLKVALLWILWLDKICTLKNYKYPR